MARRRQNWERNSIHPLHDRLASKLIREAMIEAFLAGELDLYVSLDKALRHMLSQPSTSAFQFEGI